MPAAPVSTRRNSAPRSVPTHDRSTGKLLSPLLAILLLGAAPHPVLAGCATELTDSSLPDLVERVRSDRIRYVFVGERHDVGPVKRFAVELANSLASAGEDVGLYVEGFRAGCAPGDDSCWSIARLFDRSAYSELLTEARVPVHPIDPRDRASRVAHMAELLAAGPEPVRVVLAGLTHVVYARDSGADWTVFGSLRYPGPGDLARAFEDSATLTVGLELDSGATPSYRLRRGGCGVDYLLTTVDARDYWGLDARSATLARTPDPVVDVPVAAAP